jgi:hypothetical protein
VCLAWGRKNRKNTQDRAHLYAHNGEVVIWKNRKNAQEAILGTTT